MIDISHQASYPNEIAKLLKQYGAGETCYAISWSDELDGKELPLLIALEKATKIGMPSIISCIPNKIVFFQAEQESLPCPRFILRRK